MRRDATWAWATTPRNPAALLSFHAKSDGLIDFGVFV